MDGGDVDVVVAYEDSSVEEAEVHPVHLLQLLQHQPPQKLKVTKKERVSIAKFVEQHPIFYDKKADGWGSTEV